MTNYTNEELKQLIIDQPFEEENILDMIDYDIEQQILAEMTGLDYIKSVFPDDVPVSRQQYEKNMKEFQEALNIKIINL